MTTPVFKHGLLSIAEVVSSLATSLAHFSEDVIAQGNIEAGFCTFIIQTIEAHRATLIPQAQVALPVAAVAAESPDISPSSPS